MKSQVDAASSRKTRQRVIGILNALDKCKPTLCLSSEKDDDDKKGNGKAQTGGDAEDVNKDDHVDEHVPQACQSSGREDWREVMRQQLRKKYAPPIQENKELQPPPPVVKPVLKLTSMRFRLPNESAPPGTLLKLKMVKQYPSQQIKDRPLFELEELSEAYEEMELRMQMHYTKCVSIPKMARAQIVKGNYAILRIMPCQEEVTTKTGLPRFIRIKFLEQLKPNIFQVEFVDYCTVKTIQLNDSVLPLDKQFADLPPRVCAIYMEGISFYKGGNLQEYIRYESKRYIFNGTLTAEVQRSGSVIVWSDSFPKEKYPCGINEYIFKQMWLIHKDKDVLPPVGYHKPRCYVAHAEDDGTISIQFDSMVSRHFMDIFTSLNQDEIRRRQGSVSTPKLGEVYLAPSQKDEYYYRGVIQNSTESSLTGITMDDMVTIRFLDYGDKHDVMVKQLVMAKDMHPLLPKFPEMCVKVHLQNVKQLDSTAYIARNHDNEKMYIVHVVQAASNDEDGLPEVILKTNNMSGGDCVNRRVTEGEKENELLAKPIVPGFKYDTVPDYGPVLTKYEKCMDGCSHGWK